MAEIVVGTVGSMLAPSKVKEVIFAVPDPAVADACAAALTLYV